MITSKIKEVVKVSPPYGKFNTLYHNLVMENGDKINIGKAKEQLVGWELTYEIVEEGQQEYNKAKAVQKEQNFPKSFNTQSTKPDSVQEYDARRDSIERQCCIKSASNFCSAYIKVGNSVNADDVIRIANIFNDWIKNKEVKTETIVKKAINTETDLPF